MSDAPLIKVEHLKKYFDVKKGRDGVKKTLKAVDDISFSIGKSEIVGLVGESGCGKSTLGRTVLQLQNATAGSIHMDGVDLTKMNKNQLRETRKKMQMIFQNPFSSLNPRMKIFDAIKAPLDEFHIGSREERVKQTRRIMDIVGLSEAQGNKYPHEMSGGQRQRVVIARAMVLNPTFVVCDEPVSALDVSIRSQVLNLMKELQIQTKVSYLFISHDLSVVSYLCDRIMVMYLGQIVEEGTEEEVFQKPQHPYTRALISSIPLPDVNIVQEYFQLTGEVPSPVNIPSGCRFHARCPYAAEKCMNNAPELMAINGTTHKCRCHLTGELK